MDIYRNMKMNKPLKTALIAICLPFIGIQAMLKTSKYEMGILFWISAPKFLQQTSAGKYTIKRSTGKFSEYKTIGNTSSTTFVDKKPKGNPHDYYYQIMDSKGELLASISMDTEIFGDYVYIYSVQTVKRT